MDEAAVGREADDEPEGGAADGEEDQWERHHRRRFVGVVVKMVIARIAVERQPEGARHVERGENGGQDADRPERDLPAQERRPHDLVLRPEARERRQRGERATGDEHRPVGDGHLAAQTTHLPHVLFALHRVDHRSGPEEQERLEERVRGEVEDRRRRRAHTEREEHVPGLAHRRVRHHALDVELNERDGRGEDRCDRADDTDELQRRPGGDEERRAAGDEIHARRHHRGGVDERRHRRRPLHRIGQP